MLKKRIVTVILILVIVAGLSLMLYPTVADYVNSLSYRRVIKEYDRAVQELDTEEYERILREAMEYNERLSKRTLSPLSLSDEERAVYIQKLNATGNGVMGYVLIPAQNISLPIYHGTEEAVLQSGVGHLEGSSLPVGGASTHCILSGHTGLPSSKLFTNIDRMKEGDTFSIRVLNEVLTYEVDQIRVVLPYVLSELNIEPGQDLCTLVTCTPYGVNTHRLLVRGHRIETPPQEEQPSSLQSTITNFLTMGHQFDPMMLIPVAIAILVVALFVALAVRNRRRKKKQKNAVEAAETEASERAAPEAPEDPTAAPADETETQSEDNERSDE